jgi:hypothetical protein
MYDKKKTSPDTYENRSGNSNARANIEAQETYMKSKKAVSSGRMSADSTRQGKSDMKNYKVSAMKEKLAKKKMQ